MRSAAYSASMPSGTTRTWPAPPIYALYALQHRGQDELRHRGERRRRDHSCHKDTGLVPRGFHPRGAGIAGRRAAWPSAMCATAPREHADRASAPSRWWCATSRAPWRCAHNGSLTNARELRERAGAAAARSSTPPTTAEVIAYDHHPRAAQGRIASRRRVAAQHERTRRARIRWSSCRPQKLIARARSAGLPPAVHGRARGGSIVFASESLRAATRIGAQLVRDVEPGEIVVVDENGRAHRSARTCGQQRPPLRV